MITEKKYVKVISNPATQSVESGGSVVINNQDITITENGVYHAEEGYTGIGTATVNVPSATTTLSVTENGTYTPSSQYVGYSSVVVNVPASQPSVFGINDMLWTGLSVNNGVLSKNTIVVQGYGEFPALTGTPNFYGVTSITGNGVLYNKFIGQSGITGTADFSTCEFITGSEALREAFQESGISGLNFSNLRSIRADSVFNTCCYGAVDLTSINFSNLEEIIGGYVFHFAFVDCGLTVVSFDKLETINGDYVFAETFRGNNRLVALMFPALNSVTGSNVFADMLYNCDGVTVHFPTAMQSALENDPAVVNGFGGTNITVLFDL